MNNKTRTKILSTIYHFSNECGYVNGEHLLMAFNRKKMTKAFDNTIMRFVRRLTESGVVKRINRGEYKMTAKGRTSILKKLS